MYVDLHFAVVSALLNLAIVPALMSMDKPPRSMCLFYAVLLSSLAIPSLLGGMVFNAVMVIIGGILWTVLSLQKRSGIDY